MPSRHALRVSAAAAAPSGLQALIFDCDGTHHCSRSHTSWPPADCFFLLPIAQLLLPHIPALRLTPLLPRCYAAHICAAQLTGIPPMITSTPCRRDCGERGHPPYRLQRYL